jgi:hypothetical protein
MPAQARKPLVFADDGLHQQLQAGDWLSLLDAVNNFTKAQRSVDAVLTSTAGHVAVDFAYENFSHATAENTILDFPSNMPADGQTQSGVIKITQGATPRAMAFAAGYVFPNGFYTLTATGGAFNLISYAVINSTTIHCWMS